MVVVRPIVCLENLNWTRIPSVGKERVSRMSDVYLVECSREFFSLEVKRMYSLSTIGALLLNVDHRSRKWELHAI